MLVNDVGSESEASGTADGATLAIVRAITTIDEDGDAAWRVLAIGSETHTLSRLHADWSEVSAPPAGVGEGVGVASPLLFVPPPVPSAGCAGTVAGCGARPTRC